MDIRKLQSNMYKILLETTNVLTDNDIPYHLSDGSLLGAVRHQGFIPWDDDMDISLKREDYDKAIEALINNLDPSVFFVQNYHTDKNFPHTFTRVCLVNSIGKQRNWQFLKMRHLIFIDVFPLDSFTDSLELSKRARKVDSLIRLKGIKAKHFVLHKSESQSIKEKILYSLKYFTYFLLKPVSMVFLNQRHESAQINNNISKLSNDINTLKYISLYSGTVPNLHNLMITNSELNNLVKVRFEKDYFFIPHNYDSLLTNNYGNYLEWPSIESRTGNHDFIEIHLDSHYLDLLD